MAGGIDFNFLAPKEDAEKGGTAVLENLKDAVQEETEPIIDESDVKDIAKGISSYLAPKPEEEEEEKPVKPEPKKAEIRPEPEKPAKQPIFHDQRLLQLAGANGIGPDEAANYTTPRALLAEIRLREMERGLHKSESPEKKAKETVEDDLTPPAIEFDEDTDPKIKAAIETTLAYAKKIKDRADERVSEALQEANNIKTEHEQAAIRETRQTEAKIAQMFDEKVASWGEPFKELYGVPQETWRQPGTPQHEELVKLRNYVMRSKLGFEAMTGESPSLEDIAGFLEEARGALHPNLTMKVARGELASNTKKQKGGVALRPGRARSTEPPEQGDNAARAAIGDLLHSYGVSPWGKRA